MKKIYLSSLIILVALTNAKPQSFGQRWVKIHSGNEIPPDAVVGGKDGDGNPLYVSHANYGGNWHPGKTRRDWNSTSIEYGNKEVNVGDYEILVGNDGLSWVNVSDGNMPHFAVQTGHENENNLYTCRCQYQGTTQVGKTWQGINACRIGYGGNGIPVPVYEVLVYSGPTSDPRPDNANANIIGTWTMTTSLRTGCDVAQMNYAESPCKDNGIMCATVVLTPANTWSDSNGGKGTYSITGDKIKMTSSIDGAFQNSISGSPTEC